MIVLKGNSFPISGTKEVCLSLGVFDGVHIGHINILEKLKQVAREFNLQTLVITLHPDPEKVLNPEARFTVLTPIYNRISYFESLGIDYCYILEVDRNVLSYSCVEFFQKFIYQKFQPRAIVVGEDFRFGRDRKGDVNLLEEYSRSYKFQLHILSHICMFGKKVSSSEIRKAIGEGDIEKAQILLGRLPELSGRVVRGEGRGRQLGFPTANLLTDYEFQIAKGVYIGEAVIREERMPALLYVGTSPSFGGRFLRYEIFIPNYSGNLYGRNVSFLLRQRLREERIFRDKDELQKQLTTDRENLIRYLASLSRV